MYQVLLKINEVLIVICKTPSKAYFPKCLIYVNYMRLHRDSLRSRSVVNASKRILGACGSLSDQFFSANTFRRICKIPLSTTAKSYSHTYSPALEPCGHHLGPQFSFCGHTAPVVAFGRPGVLEGPRCDICHILHIMPYMSYITYNAIYVIYYI